MKKYNVCVVGATGLVGTEMLGSLENRQFPIAKIKALATARSAGSKVTFGGESIIVEEINNKSFEEMDFALFSGGEIASEEFAKIAVGSGCIVIDNSAAFRMDPEVPLIVPEVNPHALKGHSGIIANPNCSTIQMVMAMKPIYDKAGIKRVIVSTFQSVAGTGKAALSELEEQSEAILAGKNYTTTVYPHRIAFNILPQIGSFGKNGYSSEEMKMILETKKIMGDENIKVSATTVRVPVMRGHSESVNIETETKLTAEEARKLLAQFPGIVVIDDPDSSGYPMPYECAGREEVFVGRIREDLSCKNGLEMWVVADNLLKGAATNAVQIAELIIQRNLFNK